MLIPLQQWLKWSQSKQGHGFIVKLIMFPVIRRELEISFPITSEIDLEIYTLSEGLCGVSV